MWRETYDAVFRACADSGDECAAERLLAAVNDTVDLQATTGAKAKLSAVGRELVCPLRAVLMVDSKTPRVERLGLFKLQVVCRLFLCCEDGVFDAIDQADVPSKARERGKKKKKNSAKKTGKKDEKMNLRNELRELLDRIALLIDSANPASIADGEDESSPFHAFLIGVLEKRLGALLPDVFVALREVYELTEDDTREKPSLALTAIDLTEEPRTNDGSVTDSSSILSALKDERPSKKRSLVSTSDAFKEVLLPGQLAKPTPTKALSQQRDKTSLSASEGTSHSASRTGLSTASSSKSTKRPMPDSLVSLAAASKKPKTSFPSNSVLTKAMSMPMLIRNVDRQMLQSRSTTSSAGGPGSFPSSKVAVPGSRTAPMARPSAPNVSHLSRMSVVMRTPDRPQRVQRSQPRILIEASPPLRNPFTTARLRRPGPQMPK